MRAGVAAPTSASSRHIAVLLAIFATFALTMSTFSVDDDPSASDVPQYRPMAEAAPGLPDSGLGSAYTGRFVVHYAVGLLEWATPLSVEAAYAVAFAATLLALLLLAHRLLAPLPLPAYGLCISLLLLNPYFLRVASVKMGALQDLVLVVGVALAVLGLLRVRPPLVVAGLLVAICGRQTALLVAPVAAFWIYFERDWRELASRPRAAWAVACLAVTAGAHAAIKAVVASFSKPFEPSFPGDTLLVRLDELPVFAGELAEHVARTGVPLVPALTVVGVLVARAGLRQVPAPVWWLLAVAAAIVVQPLAIDPAFSGFARNEQRLAGLGLFPVVIACGVMIGRWAPVAVPAWLLATGGAALLLASLHADYAIVGPGSDALFLAVQLVATATLAAVVWRTVRRVRPAR